MQHLFANNLLFSDQGNQRIRKISNVGQADIEEFTNGYEQTNIYPNPSNGNVFIQIDNIDNTSVEVYNALGEMVYTKTLNATIENINLEKLNAGVYFLHVKQNCSYIYRSNVVLNK